MKLKLLKYFKLQMKKTSNVGINQNTVLPLYNANIGTLPFFGIMAGWHYGEGGDLGLWIYDS